MPTQPVNARLDVEQVAAIDAMADHRNLNRTRMLSTIVDVTLSARQRACRETHRAAVRCGVCGLLIAPEQPNPERI